MDPKNGSRVWYVTIATKTNENLDLLKKLCRMHDTDIIVLGMGDRNLTEWGRNFGIKMKYLRKFLSRNDIAEDDIILFTDAYDILLCDSMENIVGKYMTFGSDIVFAAERFCHPDVKMKRSYRRFWENRGEDHQDLEMFLNSGAFIGRKWAIRDCLSRYRFRKSTDDQRYWTSIYLDQDMLVLEGLGIPIPTIDLDFYSYLFICLAGSEDDVYMSKKGKWRNRITGTEPSILHLNGNIKETYQKYYDCYLNRGATNPTQKVPKRMSSTDKFMIGFVALSLCWVLLRRWMGTKTKK